MVAVDVWFALATRFRRDPAIVELRAEFGAKGPLMVVVLLCEAKEVDDGGRVEMGYRQLADEAALDGPEEAKAILQRAVDYELLIDLELRALDFAAAFKPESWGRWQRDRTPAKSGAARTRKWRERRQAAPATAPDDQEGRDENVTARHRNVTDVTERDVGVTLCDDVTTTDTGTGKESSETYVSSDSVERRALDVGREDSESGTARAESRVARELFAYWQERCRHPQAKPTRDRLRKVVARLREGYTPEQIREAIDGAAVAAFVDEKGKRFDDLELICRTGSKLESFIERGRLAEQRAGATRAEPSHEERVRRLAE